MNDSVQFWQMNNAVLVFIGGLASGFFGAFITGLVGEIFGERARQNRHKIDVAREVHKLCTEASTYHFQHLPRDMERIFSVVTDVDGINKDMGKVLNRFVTLWQLLAKRRPATREYSHDENSNYQEMSDEIEKKRKILVKWSSGIRRGKRFIWF